MKLINIVMIASILMLVVGIGLADTGGFTVRSGQNITMQGGKILNSPNGTSETDLMTVVQGFKPGVVLSRSAGIGVDFLLDGVADDVQIESALSAYKTVYIQNDASNSKIMLAGSIDIPTTPGEYRLIGLPNKAGHKPTILPTTEVAMISGYWRGSNFEISGLHFNAAGKNIWILTQNRGGNLYVHDNQFEGVVQSTTTIKGAVSADSNADSNNLIKWQNIIIERNNFTNITGIPIHTWTNTGYSNVQSKIDIRNNFIYRCKLQGSASSYGMIHTKFAGIYENTILACTNGTNFIEYGIHAQGSRIIGNTIIGIGNGICPQYRCTVIGNTIKFANQCGINNWYSDGSTYIGNVITDCGQGSTEPPNGWDRVGIDLADHSFNVTVIGNSLGNVASGITDTFRVAATAGNNYIEPTLVTNWYPNMNISLDIGGTHEYVQSTYIDVPARRIYLNTNLAYSHDVGDAVAGVDRQLWGIGVGVTGYGGESMYVAGNTFYGNLFGSVGDGYATASQSLIPYSYIEGWNYTSLATAPSARKIPITYYDTAAQKYYLATNTAAGWKKVEIA